MTDAEINQLRDLLRAATPGPWKNHTHEEDDGLDWATISATPVVARSGYKWTPTVGVCDGGDSVENAKNAALIVAAVNALPGLLDEIERLKRACSMLNDEVSQTLGRALGYPKFCDDQKNFPGATDADGVCVGDHVAESLAAEASKEIERLRAMLSAAGCMMPPASGVIQLDTNDRIALDAAIDADMDGEPDDRQ